MHTLACASLLKRWGCADIDLSHARLLMIKNAGVPKPDALPVPWKQVAGILFDVDGTLTHSDDLHFKAFVDLLQKENFKGKLSGVS
jgi:hypothetical protein